MALLGNLLPSVGRGTWPVAALLAALAALATIAIPLHPHPPAPQLAAAPYRAPVAEARLGSTLATAASVALLHAAVGTQLAALDQARGPAAVRDLWPLYLEIRITDVLGDARKLDDTGALLQYLRERIAYRSRYTGSP